MPLSGGESETLVVEASKPLGPLFVTGRMVSMVADDASRVTALDFK